MEDKYIVRETKENGSQKDYPCKTYEEARQLLDEKAEADKQKKQNQMCEIKHGEERYTRICNESLISYALSIVETTVK